MLGFTLGAILAGGVKGQIVVVNLILKKGVMSPLLFTTPMPRFFAPGHSC